MSRTITKATLAMEAKHDFSDGIFECKVKLAPNCSGKGYSVGKGQKICSLCLNVKQKLKHEKFTT